MNNMTKLPIIGYGSQPQEADGAALDFMRMPDAMATFTLPQTSLSLDPRAKALLETVLGYLDSYQANENHSFDLHGLGVEALAFIDEVLGEGEVGIIHQSEFETHIQESILAGVWRVQTFNAQKELVNDLIEIGEIPYLVKAQTFRQAAKQLHIDTEVLPEGLMNALPLVAELNAQITAFNPEELAHVINLSLLPQTEQDLAFLYQVLGKGTTTVLSRGYGTNRITSTLTDKVWWVQYFNSEDTLILNTLEVSSVPSVACAALEDLADSAVRLREILEIF